MVALSVPSLGLCDMVKERTHLHKMGLNVAASLWPRLSLGSYMDSEEEDHLFDVSKQYLKIESKMKVSAIVHSIQLHEPSAANVNAILNGMSAQYEKHYLSSCF
jgi:hypothetical protein